jgi:D-threo-aldose 1-dehydrogenase
MALMRTVRLGETGIETTVLGLGCADLFRLPPTERDRLLAAAYDEGIRHYDVAPMYGLGSAERELGRFANGRREELVIATKFGIAPTWAGRLLAPVQRPLVRLRGRGGGGDPRSGAVGRALYSSHYDEAAARRSLEASLRALRTDYVDLLFLHEPSPGERPDDDVRAFLESAVAAGTIRSWGIAGEPAAVDVPVPVAQVRADIFDRSLRRVPARAAIAFGAIGRALPRILTHVRSDPLVRRRWGEAVGADCGDAGVVAPLLLRDAMRENGRGAVLFSTTRRERVAGAVRATEDDGGLEAFRALVEGELTG